MVPADPVLAEAKQRDLRGEHRQVLQLLARLDLSGLRTADRARVHLLRASAFCQAGRYQESLRSITMAERIATHLNSADLLAQVEACRAEVFRFRGPARRHLDHAQASLRWAEQAGQPALIAAACGLMSSAYGKMGDLNPSLHFALRQQQIDPSPSDRARYETLFNLGWVYSELYEQARSTKLFEEALAVARRARYDLGIVQALGQLGFHYTFFERNRDKAMPCFEEAIALARKIGVPAVEARMLHFSGRLLRDFGEWDDALRRFRLALAIERKHGGHATAPVILKNIGFVLARTGRQREAERFLLQAIEEGDRYNHFKARWQARMELAGVLSASAPERAERYFSECLAIFDEHLTDVLLESFRASTLEGDLQFFDPYDLYIEHLLKQGKVSAAFRVAEQARARAFLDLLVAARAELATQVPARYVEEERAVLQRISETQSKLRSNKLAPLARKRIETSVARDEDELTALRLRLAAEQPAVAQARFARLYTPEELASEALGPDDYLIAFFLGKQRSVCWVVGKRRTDWFALPPRSEIESEVRAFLDYLKTPQAAPGGQSLFQKLFRDISARVPEGARLIVVPDRALHYVPFEALSDGRRYLIERYAISYAPSASSYAFLRRLAARPARRDEFVLAVGSPAFSLTTPSSERMLALSWVDSLKPLVHASRELADISRVFPSRVLQGEHATETQLARSGIADAAIVHFATHGLLDEERPERSGLALVAQPPGDDGILQTREVYRLRMRASLVTLSACQTALGKNFDGEGIVGLSRAFFYAGANCVMASLWSVNDRSTAQLMGDFYRHLRAGQTIDQAARQTKLKFLEDPRFGHPYYWAPFVVIGRAGESVTLPRQRSLTSVMGPWLVAILLLPAAYVLLRRFRH